MRLIIDVDDSDRPFVEATKAVKGTVEIRSRGEVIEATVIAEADPVAAFGAGDKALMQYELRYLLSA